MHRSCFFLVAIAFFGAACVATPTDPGSQGTAPAAGPKTGGSNCGTTPVKGICYGDYMKSCPNDAVVTTDCTETSGYTCKMTDGTARCELADTTTPPTPEPNPGSGVPGGACQSVTADGVCVPGHPSLWHFCNDQSQIEEIDCQTYGGSATCQIVDGKATCKQ